MRQFNSKHFAKLRPQPKAPASTQHATENESASIEGSAVVEFIFLAVLLMIPVAYLILTVGQMQGASYAAVGAADQAAKVFVLNNNAVDAESAAQAAADLAVQDMGIEPKQSTLSITCNGDCFAPGTIVMATVSIDVQLPLVSAIPGIRATAITVESQSTAKVGRFR